MPLPGRYGPPPVPPPSPSPMPDPSLLPRPVPSPEPTPPFVRGPRLSATSIPFVCRGLDDRRLDRRQWLGLRKRLGRRRIWFWRRCAPRNRTIEVLGTLPLRFRGFRQLLETAAATTSTRSRDSEIDEPRWLRLDGLARRLHPPEAEHGHRHQRRDQTGGQRAGHGKRAAVDPPSIRRALPAGEHGLLQLTP